MRCPKCRSDDTKVIESRDASEGDAIRRRRECLVCRHRFTTYERVERPNLAVVKKGGDRELFDRNKLFAAIHRSVGKFLNSQVEIDQIVSEIEDDLYAMGVSEVPSHVIGEHILEQLAKRNAVAYVRFASVYRGFKTVEEFEDALSYIREQQSGVAEQ